MTWGVGWVDGPWSGKTTLEIPMGGFLRSLHMIVHTYKEGPYRAPRHAADRTRSRRALAGSRRAKRYGVPRKGPAGRPPESYDWPFNHITSRHYLPTANAIRLQLKGSIF